MLVNLPTSISPLFSKIFDVSLNRYKNNLGQSPNCLSIESESKKPKRNSDITGFPIFKEKPVNRKQRKVVRAKHKRSVCESVKRSLNGFSQQLTSVKSVKLRKFESTLGHYLLTMEDVSPNEDHRKK